MQAASGEEPMQLTAMNLQLAATQEQSRVLSQQLAITDQHAELPTEYQHATVPRVSAC